MTSETNTADQSAGANPSGKDLSGRKMASSFAWSSLENGGAQLAQVVVFFVAARILAPEDVGHASLALIVAQAFQSIICTSINGYVVSAADERKFSAMRSAFWLAIIAGAAQFLVVLVGAGIAVALGGRPYISGLYVVVGLTNVVVSLGIAHQAWLTRALAMRALAVRTLTSVIVAGCLGIVLALMKFGAYAIVLQTLLQAIISTSLLFLFSPWRSDSTPAETDFRHIWGFTRHMITTGALNFTTSNADMAIVGMFLGARAVGIYAVARRALFAFNGLITTALSQVSLSVFSKLNSSSAQEFEARFLGIIGLTSMLTVPMFFGVMGLSHAFVQLLFGAKWMEAAPIMAILMPIGALQSLGIYNQSFVISRGRPDLQARLAVIYALITIPVLLISAQFSPIAVAIGYTVRIYVTYPMSMALVTRHSGITTRRYLGAIAPAFICGILVGAVMLVVERFAGPAPVTQLLSAGSAALLAYIAAFYMFARTTFMQVVSLVKRHEPVLQVN